MATTDHIRVKDLINQTCRKGPHQFLYCPLCGNEASANKGDYFFLPEDHVFECCDEPMWLATKEVRIVRDSPKRRR